MFGAWPALVEKAYARFIEEHGKAEHDENIGLAHRFILGAKAFISGNDSAYKKMESDLSSVAGRHLGLEAREHQGQPTLAMLKQNRVIAVWRSPGFADDRKDKFYTRHAYAILGTHWVADAYGAPDRTKSIVSLYNPHGTSHTQTVSEFMQSWNQYALADD
ncbi:MAG: hypothetical protein IPL79_03595 [Myxococcales bacterium]|nr:hypothetical protein [Myxococcales bacterium]